MWTAAPATTNFVQGEPIEGVPAQHRTEVRVPYNEQALYVGARMYYPPTCNVWRPLELGGLCSVDRMAFDARDQHFTAHVARLRSRIMLDTRV